MTDAKEGSIRDAVRERYGDIARRGKSDCGCAPSSCCGGNEVVANLDNDNAQAIQLGYSKEDLSHVPEDANLGLGCGNPQVIAALKPGEVVLDLGSGAGFDCFLAARKVGATGKVIGVDMTPEMVSKARANAKKGVYNNVEFRLGEIEHLPVADASIDVIISNCVINLSPDKPSVFREAYRVLKTGGRLAISDVVATAEMPAEMLSNLELYSACVTGAVSIPDLEKMLAEAGFVEIKIVPKDESRKFIREWVPGRKLEDYILSATIEAKK